MQNSLTVHTLAEYAGGEFFLIMSPDEAALVDTGYDFCAGEMAARIKALLDGRALRYMLITHSHYDHLTGCARLKQAFPDTVLAAHPLVSRILEKEKNRDAMRRLNAQAAAKFHMPDDDAIDQIRLDRLLSQGDLLPFGAGGIRVLETPGHTRCSISFFFEEEKLLAASESTGAWIHGRLLPAFVASYEMALQSAQDCAGLGARRIVIPHLGELSAEQVPGYFQQARQDARQAADFVLEQHKNGLAPPDIARAYIQKFYRIDVDRQPPDTSTLLNTEAMIGRLIQG